MKKLFFLLALLFMAVPLSAQVQLVKVTQEPEYTAKYTKVLTDSEVTDSTTGSAAVLGDSSTHYVTFTNRGGDTVFWNWNDDTDDGQSNTLAPGETLRETFNNARLPIYMWRRDGSTDIRIEVEVSKYYY